MQIYDYIQAVHEDDRDGMMRSITEAIQGDHELECDIRVKKGGGGYIAFHLVGRIVSYTQISEETRLLSTALAD